MTVADVGRFIAATVTAVNRFGSASQAAAAVGAAVVGGNGVREDSLADGDIDGGLAGAPMSVRLVAPGVSGSAVWTLVSGPLPAGISLSANGVLSGTPGAEGEFPIRVRATGPAHAREGEAEGREHKGRCAGGVWRRGGL